MVFWGVFFLSVCGDIAGFKRTLGVVRSANFENGLGFGEVQAEQKTKKRKQRRKRKINETRFSTQMNISLLDFSQT